MALYRIAQEALNNIAKHVATKAAVTLHFAPTRRVTLRIRDNGRGFNPKGVDPALLGLAIMRERAVPIGATLTLHSAPEQGTEVEVVWEAQSAERRAHGKLMALQESAWWLCG